LDRRRSRQANTESIERKFTVLRLFVGIIIAILIALLLIVSVSDEPLKVMHSFLIRPFTSVRRVGYIVEKTIPLLFTGVAMSIINSSGQANLSIEGGFYLSSIATAFIATKAMPAGVHPIVCMLFAAFVGAILVAIPAIMYVRYGTLTIVVSLMINYIYQYIGTYIMHYTSMRDPAAGFDGSYKYLQTAILPKLFSKTNIHLGLIIAIAVVILGYWLLYKNTWGYTVRMTGKNAKFSKFAGMNINKAIVTSALLAGAITGLGAAVEQLGLYSRMSYTGLPGYGWDGVMIATLSQNNPAMVPISALFLGYLSTGSNQISQTMDIPIEIVNIIQSVVIIFAAAEHFLDYWKHKEIVKASQKVVAEEDAKKALEGKI